MTNPFSNIEHPIETFLDLKVVFSDEYPHRQFVLESYMYLAKLKLIERTFSEPPNEKRIKLCEYYKLTFYGRWFLYLHLHGYKNHE